MVVNVSKGFFMISNRSQFGVVDVQKEIEARGAKVLRCKLSLVCFASGVLVCSPLAQLQAV